MYVAIGGLPYSTCQSQVQPELETLRCRLMMVAVLKITVFCSQLVNIKILH